MVEPFAQDPAHSGGQDPVTLRLIDAAGTTYPGRIQRIRPRGLEVRMPAGRAPRYSGPQPCTVHFETPAGAELAADVRLVALDLCDDGAALLALRHWSEPFDAPLEAAADTDSDCRRSTYRVRPSELAEIPVRLRAIADPRVSLVRQVAALGRAGAEESPVGRLFDLSLTGASVLVEGPGARAFPHGDPVELSLALPHLVAPLHVGARVLARRETCDGVRYGFEFGSSPGRPLARIEGEILDYVMTRQRQDLRHRRA